MIQLPAELTIPPGQTVRMSLPHQNLPPLLEPDQLVEARALRNLHRHEHTCLALQFLHQPALAMAG